MSSGLPRTRAKDIIRVLEKIGFSFARQSGSHKIYKNTENKRVTVPFHNNTILHPKVLKSILKDADIDAEQLKKLL
ncbi:MAG: type II toxin-antitoxin system HicA family toxin [Candidatus Niyogibacteria bacterium]|nr:MAG: type II toxin-antitoxin system HicA family toxin [Candidatus Niyogibacteria bacterium]